GRCDARRRPAAPSRRGHRTPTRAAPPAARRRRSRRRAAAAKLGGPGGAGALSAAAAAVGNWAGPPPKELAMAGGGKPTGWEEPSPPTQRRNPPNYDDGTSLWGNPGAQGRMGGKVSHWKDMPTPNMGRGGGMQCPPGMPQNRIPGNGAGNMKPDGAPLWGHPGRNGSWGEGQHEAAGPGWGEDPKGIGAAGVNSWSEPPLTPTSWGGPKPKTLTPGGWDTGDMEPASWGHAPKPGQKPLTKDIVWASKQFRILAEMGFKKEDVENALRSSNMNFEDAHEQLNARLSVADAWRRQEAEHSAGAPFDLGHGGAGPGFQRYNPVQQQPPMSFAPPGGGGVGGGPSLLNNLGGSGSGGVGSNPAALGVNSLSPAVVQKMLSAQQGGPGPVPGSGGGGGGGGPFGQAPRAPSSQPSTAQLRMLVQQIQMAVQAGYLNHQILNQPLAPQTLLLLNQLLQQIKVLQQLLQQQTVVQMQPHKGGSSSAVLHISVQITKTKQQISNLQNQIASQQAIYVKQQQQQQQQHLGGPGGGPQGPPHPTGPQDFFKQHDPLQTLNANFSDLALSKEQGSFQSQQSRLNQWKLPALDKDGDGTSNEFSRAPGTTTKPTLAQSHSSPNMNPLLGQSDSTWSSVGRPSDSGWPDSGSSDAGAQDNKDPWPTGTQMKSIEDDPSITPGSVVRSPLSLASIKDSEIFSGGGGSKTSPTVSVSEPPLPPLSLSNSTWSFTPAPQNSGGLGKLSGGKVWGDAPPPTTVTSELWGAPMGKARGPPPGLGSKGVGVGGGGSSSNGWGGARAGGGGSGGWGSASSGWAPQSSAWLLLRNLTPQIDGSTLKTLCVQHGPLQNFHLYLNHGIALAKYSTREEANKAQGALNNCVLGNTTIFAESPGDSDVHALLQHLNHGAQQQAGAPQGSGGGGGGSWALRGSQGAGGGQPTGSAAGPQSKNSGPGADTWGAPGAGSQLWPAGPSGGSLWGGGGPLDASGADQHRATPSSLNSFLPGDLLGGESM
ncbi:Protein Gawky, partial [Gryllus bimaculatus]